MIFVWTRVRVWRPLWHVQYSTQTSLECPPSPRPLLLGSDYLYPPPLELSLLSTQMNNVRNDLQSTVVSYKLHPGKNTNKNSGKTSVILRTKYRYPCPVQAEKYMTVYQKHKGLIVVDMHNYLFCSFKQLYIIMHKQSRIVWFVDENTSL